MVESRPLGIKPEQYFSESWFSAEQSLLENTLWNFAGLVRDVAGDNDFLTVPIGSKSVILQNFKGEIRAFDNVCAHRFSRIRACERGNGLLRCPYHSWVYNSEGVPVSIPSNENAFGFDAVARAQHSLKRWRVEQCGELLFVCADHAARNLRSFLGDMFEELEALSNCLGNEMDVFSFEYEANWKICVENTLDEYHATFVHPTTFRPMLSGGFTYGYDRLLSKVEASVTDETQKSWGRLEKFFAARPLKTDTYFHYAVFPLTTLASTFGVNFSLQTFVPQSPRRTLFKTRLFLSKFEDGRLPPAGVVKALGQSAAEFNRTVFLEDKFICEQVQLGLQQNSGLTGALGHYEQRISHFHQALDRIHAGAWGARTSG